MRSVNWFLTAAVLSSGCTGGMGVPTMEGRQGMLSKTAIAAKCKEAAEEHLKPFVVEWDATDLASFEAKASEGTVLVRYEGCDLVPLYECSGSRRFGGYGTPHFTSGTVQGFDMKNEGELYANLPLGAVKLSGRVEAGEDLHLKYFVSGVATSSRDALYQGELKELPGCETATHYVWAYNLGAFELSSRERSGGSVEAGAYGVGLGGKRSTEEAQVGQGGDLKSCTSQEQRACRVPIRFALRPIKAGEHPAGGLAAGPPGAPTGAPSGSPGDGGASGREVVAVAESVVSLFQSANQKLLEKFDGEGCLRDMEQVFRLDPRQRDNVVYKKTHIRCLMRAGRCDEGSADYRDLIAAEDNKRIKTDAKLDEEVREEANRYCSAGSAKNDADAVMRASREMGELSHQDADACKTKFALIAGRFGKLTRDDRDARNRGRQALQSGVRCVLTHAGCDAAYPLFERYTQLDRPNAADFVQLAKRDWPSFAKGAKVECK